MTLIIREFVAKKEKIRREFEILDKKILYPTPETNDLLKELGKRLHKEADFPQGICCEGLKYPIPSFGLFMREERMLRKL